METIISFFQSCTENKNFSLLLHCCKIALNNGGTGCWAQVFLPSLSWIILFSGFTLNQSVPIFFWLVAVAVLKNVIFCIPEKKKKGVFLQQVAPSPMCRLGSCSDLAVSPALQQIVPVALCSSACKTFEFGPCHTPSVWLGAEFCEVSQLVHGAKLSFFKPGSH